MFKQIIVATIAIASLAIGATRSEAAPEAAMRGVGTSSCAEFGKEYAIDPKGVELIYFSWAQGFMSGYDFAEIGEKKPYFDLNTSTADEQQREIREYCDAHPLATYLDAVLEVLAPMRRHTLP